MYLWLYVCTCAHMRKHISAQMFACAPPCEPQRGHMLQVSVLLASGIDNQGLEVEGGLPRLHAPGLSACQLVHTVMGVHRHCRANASQLSWGHISTTGLMQAYCHGGTLALSWGYISTAGLMQEPGSSASAAHEIGVGNLLLVGAAHTHMGCAISGPQHSRNLRQFKCSRLPCSTSKYFLQGLVALGYKTEIILAATKLCHFNTRLLLCKQGHCKSARVQKC